MAIKTLILDTNIVLDLLVFQDSRANWIRDGIARGQFELIYSSEMLVELTDVIARPQFAQSGYDQSTVLSSWTQMAIHKPRHPAVHFVAMIQMTKPSLIWLTTTVPVNYLARIEKFYRCNAP